MLIYSDTRGVVLENSNGATFVIPYSELAGVHKALAPEGCKEGNVYLSPCPCVRHGANNATRMAAVRP